jgi:hypothetical protein
MNKYGITFVMIIVGLVYISETTGVIAQNNSANSEIRNIIVTWMDSNDTNDTPPVNISHEEFWAVFNSFLKPPINSTGRSIG